MRSIVVKHSCIVKSVQSCRSYCKAVRDSLAGLKYILLERLTKQIMPHQIPVNYCLTARTPKVVCFVNKYNGCECSVYWSIARTARLTEGQCQLSGGMFSRYLVQCHVNASNIEHTVWSCHAWDKHNTAILYFVSRVIQTEKNVVVHVSRSQRINKIHPQYLCCQCLAFLLSLSIISEASWRSSPSLWPFSSSLNSIWLLFCAVGNKGLLLKAHAGIAALDLGSGLLKAARSRRKQGWSESTSNQNTFWAARWMTRTHDKIPLPNVLTARMPCGPYISRFKLNSDLSRLMFWQQLCLRIKRNAQLAVCCNVKRQSMKLGIISAIWCRNLRMLICILHFHTHESW